MKRILLCAALAICSLGCQSQAQPEAEAAPAEEAPADPMVGVFEEAVAKLIAELEAHVEGGDHGAHDYVVGVNVSGLRDRAHPVAPGTSGQCRKVLVEALGKAKRLSYSDSGASMHAAVNGELKTSAVSASETEYTVALEVRQQGGERARVAEVKVSRVVKTGQ